MALAHLSRPDVNVVNGAYYEELAVSAPAPLVDNAHAVRRLWKLTTRIVGRDRLLPAAA